MIKLPIAVVGNDHPAQSMVGAQSRLLGPHPVLGHDRPGAGDQAHWIAYTALKQKFEKRGDHWIAKDNPADCDGAGGPVSVLPAETAAGSRSSAGM